MPNLNHLDKILHTPTVVRNTHVGRLRPRSARGRLQAKPERLCFFVILVTPPKFYIETTNRRDFGFGGNRADSGSVGHGSNESTNLGGSRDPLTHNQILFILLVCCLLFCRFISHRCHHGKSHFTLYSSGIPRDFLVHGKPATALKTVLLTVC